MINVESVADSINQQNDRLISMVLTYPRIIHAEMMTHRMFSRNASSSRAVPVQKMIEAVKNNTFCPFEFQKAHKGMQGSEYFTDEDKEDCIKLWLESAELALQQAEKMKEKGITKQIINRILEPYQYYTMLITGNKEGWNNFFELRCPDYVFHNEDDEYHFKSKKEVVAFGKSINDTKIEYPNKIEVEMESLTYLDWLKLNKGQAEIHMMTLSEKIYDAIQESVPRKLKEGEWHIPMGDKIPFVGNITESIDVNNTHWQDYDTQNRVKISVALAARTSYTIVGDEKEIDYKKMIELHNRLLSQNPPHSSPMEHCCLCVTEDEYNNSFKGQEKGWFRNYKGFKSYRQIIEEK